jgi:hypothetical protein
MTTRRRSVNSGSWQAGSKLRLTVRPATTATAALTAAALAVASAAVGLVAAALTLVAAALAAALASAALVGVHEPNINLY